MESKGTILMKKYEVGKLLGQGTFAKVHHARNLKTNQNVAIKTIDKEKVMNQTGLIEQIKREISVMHLVKHPNVIHLHEIMATKTNIYMVMEYAKGGELFTKVSNGRLNEDSARKYFQQLIAAVDFCHSRGVYHRDLKPENLLLDEFGNLKVSDFGLSALIDSKRKDGLLHTTCGTPAYVAPEVISKRGYDGEKSDIWSCGVILYVLLAGYLPFQDSNLMEMYRKICKGDFKCPNWFPPEVRKLLSRILSPNPKSRVSLCGIMENHWVNKGLSLKVPSIDFEGKDGTSCQYMNAFDIISLSRGFDLSGIFEEENGLRAEEWFTTRKPPEMVVARLEELAVEVSFKIKKKDGLVKMQGNRGLEIGVEIFEVTPSFHIVDVNKTAGDKMEYLKFRDQKMKPLLRDVIWSWQGGDEEEEHHV